MTLIAVIADTHFDNWSRWSADPLAEEGLEDLIRERKPELLVVAGDLSNDPIRTWPKALVRLGRLIDPSRIAVIPGNHDFYSFRLDGEHLLREMCSRAGVRFAQKEEIRLGKTRILCCTLWTDFALTGDVRHAAETAARVMYDYRLIHTGVSGLPFGRQDTRLITPQDILMAHRDHRAWLEGALRAPHFAGDEGRTVVVTHHGPSPATAAGEIDSLTPAFHSDLNDLIIETGPDVWFFGHSHRRCRATVGRTDIRCVSIGYIEEQGTHALRLGPLTFFETD